MPATEIRDEKLDFWIEIGVNALFIGRHGCGKSTRIFDAFNRAGLRWAYFSAPTLDPWVDFVGVPEKVTDAKGSYIDLVLPKRMRDDEIDAIFIDELNRAKDKIQNAVFELVQFRSINGRRFENLKIIWASINPDCDDYKTENLDLALKDRFEVWCDVPYEPKVDWFIEKFGEKLGTGAVAWWNELSDELKLEVTPRRIQYVLNMYQRNGDVRDCLPKGCNVTKLLSCLSTGPVSEKLKVLYTSHNQDDARKYLNVENNYSSAVKHLQSPHEFSIPAQDWYGFFIPVLPNEKISNLIATNTAICDFVMEHPDMGSFTEIIENIVSANQNKGLVRKIKKKLGSTNTLAGKFGKLRNIHAEPAYHSGKTNGNWGEFLQELSRLPMEKTPDRMKVYFGVVKGVPEAMTTDESLGTLELLGKIAGRCWPETLKDMHHLLGIINHCITEANKTTGMGWLELLHNYPSKFERLLQKLTDAGLERKLYIPMKVFTQEDVKRITQEA